MSDHATADRTDQNPLDSVPDLADSPLDVFGAEPHVLHVRRIGPETYRGRPVDTGELGTIEMGEDLVARIRERWGGGLYQIRGKDSRGRAKAHPIKVPGRPYPAFADEHDDDDDEMPGGSDQVVQMLYHRLASLEESVRQPQQMHPAMQAQLGLHRSPEVEALKRELEHEKERRREAEQDLRTLRQSIEVERREAKMQQELAELRALVKHGGSNNSDAIEAKLELIKAQARQEENRAQRAHELRMQEIQKDPMAQLERLNKLAGGGNSQKMQLQDLLEMVALMRELGLGDGGGDDDSWRGLIKAVLPEVKALAARKMEEAEAEQAANPPAPAIEQQPTNEEKMLQNLVKVSRRVAEAIRAKKHPQKAAAELVGFASALGADVEKLIGELRGSTPESVRDDLRKVPAIYPGASDLHALATLLDVEENRAWMSKFLAGLA